MKSPRASDNPLRIRYYDPKVGPERPTALPENWLGRVVSGMVRSVELSRKPEVSALVAFRFDDTRDIYLPHTFGQRGGEFFTHDVYNDTWHAHHVYG
jgi:hypothetical protein